jgi:lysophospholipase L1-like esterase
MNLDRILPVFAPLLRRSLRSKQRAREAQFAAVPRSPDRVVFLGDSITEWTAWEDWFPELPTTNRGIGGQAICDVMGRLDSAIVAPRAISLLIGTNDLHGLGESSEVSAIISQMDELVDRIRTLAPSSPLFVTSVTPRSVHFRDRIIDLNLGYARIASGSGATFIDLWPVLADANGAILSEQTIDGLHLSVGGYRSWVNVLRSHLAPFTV